MANVAKQKLQAGTYRRAVRGVRGVEIACHRQCLQVRPSRQRIRFLNALYRQSSIINLAKRQTPSTAILG
jgi:hypothetical protein